MTPHVTPSSVVLTRNRLSAAGVTFIPRNVTLRNQDGIKPNLKNEVEPDAFPTALDTAHYILDLSSVEYPEGIQRPRMDLNENARAGRFRYERKSNRIYLL